MKKKLLGLIILGLAILSFAASALAQCNPEKQAKDQKPACCQCCCCKCGK